MRRFRGSRLTVALWVVAALAAAGLTAALLVRDDGEHDDVAAYIEDVNAAQRPLAVHYGQIGEAFRRFTLGDEAAADEQAPQLRRAAQRLGELRETVAGIEAPPAAAELRSRMLALLRHEEALAYELLDVVLYLPELAAAEQPLEAAARRLRQRLDAAGSTSAQADALQAYARELRRLRRSLEELEPPALLAASHRGYVSQLRSHTALTEQLQRAVRARDDEAVERATARLREATRAQPGAAEAHAAAVKAYNRRVGRVRDLAAARERERARLEREL